MNLFTVVAKKIIKLGLGAFKGLTENNKTKYF